jgi:hypothetical protein
MFEGGRKNKLRKFQTLLHPPTHTACPPPCVGLPLASPSLSLGQKPKTGLRKQAEDVLTQPQQSQPACRVRLSAVLAQAGMQTGRSYLNLFGSSATPFMCLPFVKKLKVKQERKKSPIDIFFIIKFNRK